MKQCKAKGCLESKLFTHGYCNKHKYIYYQSRGKLPLIPPRSDKRQKLELSYSKIRKELINELSPDDKCWFCGKNFTDIPDLHHALGRIETLLVEIDNLKPVHRHCHKAYHDFSLQQLTKLDWYSSFIERMKVELPTIYDREINKQLKQ